MRRATTVAAVLVVGSILAASAFIFANSQEYNDRKAAIDEEYDVDGYKRALEDAGFSTWDPGRLFPGAFDGVMYAGGILTSGLSSLTA